MPEHDLPPELRQQRNSRPPAIPLELPLDDELIRPVVPENERRKPDEIREIDPFLRRS
jgi:hypothetical protein